MRVFNNYYVTWTANSAGKTESNTSDWEYVGATVQAPSTLEAGAVQSIKYWDYSTSQYDFAAYSTGKLSSANILTTGKPSAGQVLISPIIKVKQYKALIKIQIRTSAKSNDSENLKICS